MGDNIIQTVAVQRVKDGVYSAAPFGRRAIYGNMRPIAYGGIALAQTISAAWETIPAPQSGNKAYELYSVQGSYLGPAAIDVETVFTVLDIRTTRSFCTRQVLATQGDRRIMVALLDWHVPEDGMTYDAPPLHTYEPPENLPDLHQRAKDMLPPQLSKPFIDLFALGLRLYDSRPAPPSMSAENFLGMRPGPTAQSKLPMEERTAATWVKSRVRLLTPAQQTAGLAFSMDGALAFLPLVVTGQSLTETEASASLDFSLRIFRPPNLNEFSLHEQHTEQGAHGRTFSVGKWYDRTGRLVANMSQTGILRMKSGVVAKL